MNPIIELPVLKAHFGTIQITQPLDTHPVRELPPVMLWTARDLLRP